LLCSALCSKFRVVFEFRSLLVKGTGNVPFLSEWVVVYQAAILMGMARVMLPSTCQEIR
jgi:hypothetical protein